MQRTPTKPRSVLRALLVASLAVGCTRGGGGSAGTLGILERERASWAFWRLGVRTGGTSWCRFPWDSAEWTSLTAVAQALVLWPDAATPAGIALELDDLRAW